MCRFAFFGKMLEPGGGVVLVRLCVVIEWVVVSCYLVEYFFGYLCLKFYVCAVSVRGSRDCHFGG